MTLRALFTFQALCALALSTSACGDEGTIGEVVNGAFAYSCSSDSDPLCASDAGFGDAALKSMPNNVVVGGQFGVVFRAQSSAAQAGSATVLPVSSDLLARLGGGSPTFEALKPGYAGLLAQRGSAVVDLIHVRLVDVDHIRIDEGPTFPGAGTTGASSIDVMVNDFAMLSATAVDGAGNFLAGSLSYQWTSDDPAIAAITSEPATDQITVRGVAPGQTTLRVFQKGMGAEIPILVTGSTNEPSGGGGAGGGGAGSGGAGGSP